MINIICDICKKQISAASTGYTWDKQGKNYRAIFDKAICNSCQPKFEEEIRVTMEKHTQFGLSNHNDVLRETLERMTR